MVSKLFYKFAVTFFAMSLCLSLWLQFHYSYAPKMEAPQPHIVKVVGLGGIFGVPSLRKTPENNTFEILGLVQASVGRSLIVVSARGINTKLVEVGDEVADGVILKEVHLNHVILDSNGKLKRIDLPEIRSRFQKNGNLAALDDRSPAYQIRSPAKANAEITPKVIAVEPDARPDAEPKPQTRN